MRLRRDKQEAVDTADLIRRDMGLPPHRPGIEVAPPLVDLFTHPNPEELVEEEVVGPFQRILDGIEISMSGITKLQLVVLLVTPLFFVTGFFTLYLRSVKRQVLEKEQAAKETEAEAEERMKRDKWRPPSNNGVPEVKKRPLELSEGAGTSIAFDPNTETFLISAKSSTYAFRVNELRELEHLYWGEKIDVNEDFSIAFLNSRWVKQHMDWVPVVCGDPGDGVMQRNVFLHEWADPGTGDYRRPSYDVEHADGSGVSNLKFYNYRIVMGKPDPITHGMAHLNVASNDDAQTLVVTMHDDVQHMFVELFFTVFRDSNAMVRKAIVRNGTLRGSSLEVAKGEGSPALEKEAWPLEAEASLETEFDAPSNWGDENGEIFVRAMEQPEPGETGEAKTLHSIMSCTVDFEAAGYDSRWHVTTLDGAYERERQKTVRLVEDGAMSIGSRRGQSSHQHNPFIMVSKGQPLENAGDCYAFNLVYSGNFLGEVEMIETGRMRLSMGINPETFRWHLAPGEKFETPEVVMMYSSKGCGEISRELHRLYHQHLYRGLHRNRPRPILVNTWEATYFAIEHKAVVNMAKQADKLGIDLVVLDDGWFGRRNDDTSALGDWNIVNEVKLPYGLDGLANQVRAQGVLFGIWMEPESISEDSDLYRANPDWCIHTEGRPRTRGRNQLLLDFGRAEVRQHILKVLTEILSLQCAETGEPLISYVKWDMNRCITEAGSPVLPPERQGEVTHRHILGLYEVLHTITNRFPEVLFEGCAQGGGRLDPGILCFMPQVWCSDNTDFADRLRIQFGSSLCYPVSATTAHVSDVPNHQTGRYSTLRGRALLAMGGGIGWELDVRNIQQAERRAAVAYNSYYRLVAKVVLYGDLYRLWDPFADESRQSAWMFVNETKSEAVAFAFIAWRKPYKFQPMLQMQGLDETATYVMETVQPEEAMCSKEEYKMYQLKNMIMNPTPEVMRLVLEVIKNLGPGGVLRMNAAVDALKQGDFKPLETILSDPAEYGLQVAYDALCEVEQNPENFGIAPINHGAMRSLNGKEMKGSTLMRMGIPVQFESDMDGVVIRMRKVGSAVPPVQEWAPRMTAQDGKTGRDWLIPR